MAHCVATLPVVQQISAVFGVQRKLTAGYFTTLHENQIEVVPWHQMGDIISGFGRLIIKTEQIK